MHGYFHMILYSCFQMLGLIFLSLIHFELMLYRVNHKDNFLNFYRSIYISLENFIESLFFSVCFWHICPKSVSCEYIGWWSCTEFCTRHLRVSFSTNTNCLLFSTLNFVEYFKKSESILDHFAQDWLSYLECFFLNSF